MDYGLNPHGPAVSHFDVDAIQIDDGVQCFQRTRLPSLDVLDDRVGDSGNELRRILRPVHVHQMGLNLADVYRSTVFWTRFWLIKPQRSRPLSGWPAPLPESCSRGVQ